MIKAISLIGIYSVDNEVDVHLIELDIKANFMDIEIDEFTQQKEDIDKLNWQAPYDEKYLNKQGTEIIGNWLDEPKYLTHMTRLTFFFHYLDFSKPLITPFGDIDLKSPESMPARLSSILKYVQPD